MDCFLYSCLITKMKTNNAILTDMYNFVKDYATENWIDLIDDDWSDLPIFNFYTEFANHYNLNISFDRTDNWFDTDIVCSVFCDNATLFNSIVLTWSCYKYDDLTFYKDIVSYLLSLEERACTILEKFNK